MRYLILISLLFSSFALRAETLENVLFKSQSPPGDWEHNMNCGPTSAVLVASYYLSLEPQEQDLKNVLDWLYEKNFIQPQVNAEYYDGNATTMTQLSNILSGYYQLGPIIKKNSNDLNYLKSKLSKGNPIIVGVNVQMNPQKMGHFMVLLGINETEVVVHDPGKTLGAYNTYPISQFLASWQTANYASLVVDTSEVSWHPDGSLVQVSGDNKVYVIIDSKIYWIINENVFNAHNFDWQKIILISNAELDCYDYGGEVDWQPYRELFKTAGKYYMLEKQTFESGGGTVYQFATVLAFNTWNVPGVVQDLDFASAELNYFSHYADGGLLYLRHGTIVKPSFSVPAYGENQVFVVDNHGVLHDFESEQLLIDMGYSLLPVVLVDDVQIFMESIAGFDVMITTEQSQQCLNDSSAGSGQYELTINHDLDNDGYWLEINDCNDENNQINPGENEVCDGIDNNCDGQIDEGYLCSENSICENGACLEIEDELPITDDSLIECTVICPEQMKAYVWYGATGQVSGSIAFMQTSLEEICLRGQPWIDFNCACTFPDEWSCFDPSLAQVQCNYDFQIYNPSLVDSVGEGEIWFTELTCFN